MLDAFAKIECSMMTRDVLQERETDNQSVSKAMHSLKKVSVNMFNMNEHTKYHTNRKYESQSHSIEARKRSRDFILRE